MIKNIFKISLVICIFLTSLLVTFTQEISKIDAATQCLDPDGSGPKKNCCVTCSNSQCTKIINADSCTTRCDAPNQCSSGTTCGSCPSGGSKICTPGQWAGCGSHGCGGGQTAQCNSGGTGWTCHNDPSSCSGGGSGGGSGSSCTASNPGAATQLTPANNATVPTNDVTVTFTNTTGWGKKCPPPNVNFYRIMYRLNNPATNELGVWVAGTALYSIQPYTINDLQWGKRYEWRVRKNNSGGNAIADTASRFFTINTPSTLASNGLTSLDVCGVRTSGRIEFAGVTNPITYSVGFNDSDANPFTEIRLAFIPKLGTNGLSTLYGDDVVLHSKIINSKAFAVKYSFANNSASVLGSTGSWVNESTSGDISTQDNGISILNIGGSTIGSTGGNSATASFQIRFNNNFPTDNYNIYALAINDNGTNQLVSSYPAIGDANNITYMRIDDWAVDMVPPTVDVSSPLYSSVTNFKVNWNASDSFSGINALNSFIKSDIAGSSIYDNGTAQTFNFTSADTEISAGITQPQLGNHNYTDLQTVSNTIFGFRLNVKDRACNIAEDTSETSPVLPWIMSIGSNVSGLGGIKGVSIPEQERLSIPEIGFTGLPILSTDGVISGTIDIPASKVSSTNKYVLGYNNFASKPPINSDYTNWYDHLFNKVSKNSSTPIVDSPVTNALNTMSASFGVSANSKNFFKLQSLTTQSNLICDIQAVIFIEGNLNIKPNLTNSNQLNGCIFVVKGDIIIEAGTRKSFELINSTNPAGYDLISGVFITNSNLTIPVDSFLGTEKWDGLIIHGASFAQNVTLQRNLNLTANSQQPAIVFDYDPKYLLLFGKELADRSYSLREGLN